MKKRHLLSISLAAFAGLATLPIHAQTAWPAKPVRLIVPYPPGGPVDQLARAIAPKLGEQLGQAIIIDNKAGAGGSIARGGYPNGPYRLQRRRAGNHGLAWR